MGQNKQKLMALNALALAALSTEKSETYEEFAYKNPYSGIGDMAFAYKGELGGKRSSNLTKKQKKVRAKNKQAKASRKRNRK